MATRMQQRRGTAAQWAAANPVLADGEVGYEKDTGVVKIGNGSSTWNQLPAILNGAYLSINGKAYDADRLDGLDSTAFAQKNYVDGLVTPAGASRSLVNHFGSVTGFPTVGVKLGDRCWRSDLFSEFYYNGGVWRQTDVARMTSAQRSALTTAQLANLYEGFTVFETDTGYTRTFIPGATPAWRLVSGNVPAISGTWQVKGNTQNYVFGDNILDMTGGITLPSGGWTSYTDPTKTAVGVQHSLPGRYMVRLFIETNHPATNSGNNWNAISVYGSPWNNVRVASVNQNNIGFGGITATFWMDCPSGIKLTSLFTSGGAGNFVSRGQWSIAWERDIV